MERIVSGLDDVPLEEPQPADSLWLELKTLRQALGPLTMAGPLRASSRADLDGIARMLRRMGI